jgi:hypothetical protein
VRGYGPDGPPSGRFKGRWAARNAAFTDLMAKEISEARSSAEPRAGAGTRPSPYEILIARNAKLSRANHALTGNRQLAAAQIPRLGVENTRLGEALKASSNSPRIGRRDAVGSAAGRG